MALSRAGFIFFRLTAAGTVLCLGLTACSYVGQRAFEDKVASLDQDGDGAPLDGTDNVRDCDDLDPSRAPGLDEIPYDGVDNDCKDGDLVDADGDGFHGVLKDEYQAAFPKATWPQSVVDGPVDCADDPAVYADAVNIFPGNANDPPYDGIDSNCAGDNDFDADGDGFMPDSTDEIPDVPQAVSEYLSEWGITLPNPQYGDCDDFSSDVHPGRDPADDVPYDGVDTDCAGNNDFDADGDG